MSGDVAERVARAICEAERMNPDDKLGGWVHWLPAARAAIAAMPGPRVVEHVGLCPFCGQNSAELWIDPQDDWKPFQVICRTCEAGGPRCDCGAESAVPAWKRVVSAKASPPPSPDTEGGRT